MGMTSDQNERVSFAEQEEQRKRDEAKKAAALNIPTYNVFSVIELNGKRWQILIGKDNKWYKAEYLYSKRFDELNRTPLVDIFSDKIVPLTKEEFDSYFIKSKEA